MAWAESDAVIFDPAKAEVLYFLGPRARITDLPPIIIGDSAIQESETVRWLGVFLDRGLTLRHHVAEWRRKSTRLVQHLCRLTRCTQGPPPGPLTTVIRTVVMPIALHASEVWWPGLTRETTRGRVQNSCRMQIEAIDRVLMTGIRTALPTWRTMPKATLWRETGIPLAKVLLEERRLRSAARIRRLDEFHPLRLRALESTEAARHRLGPRSSNRGRRPGNKTHGSRVQRAFRLLPETESPPPPRRTIPPPPRLCRTDNVTAAGTTMNWLSRLPQDCLCAYSDGSGATESC
ncbi:hypothetical protein K3495_g7940 [Podosphaera aphanis]|nr:hypothetical protein K3495_g7940 [Podosphaera aphanis]